MTPSEFAAKWSASTAKESAGAKEHFIDLCRLLGYQTPNEADPTGDWYAFEKGAEKTAGGDGFADVWKRGHFAWEYKGKRKELAAAYKQLLDYREALEHPPLLVVCDLDRFEVHTNFTGTVKQVHAFSLADLAAAPQEPLRILRAVMGDPEALRPQKTPEELEQRTLTKLYNARPSWLRDSHTTLDHAVLTAYGSPSDLPDEDLLARLLDLNLLRSAVTASPATS